MVGGPGVNPLLWLLAALGLGLLDTLVQVPKIRRLTLLCPGLSLLSSVVVSYRLRHEWEMGTEPPFPGGIRSSQLFGIVHSHVYAELELQGGRRVL